MNGRAMLCGAVALTTVGILAVAGCGTMRSGSMSKDDAIAQRQQLMKRQGAAFGSINRKLKAGEVPAVASDAEVLMETSKQIASLFPAGSTSPTTSRAKPEIWQQWARFEGYTKTLNAEATKLRDAARANDASATQAAFGAVNKNACTACHDAFRGPEIKK
jgi:cytochrome c556